MCVLGVRRLAHVNFAEKAWRGKPVAGSTALSDSKRRKLIQRRMTLSLNVGFVQIRRLTELIATTH